MIVVGYTADPFGAAALTRGVAEAKLRQTDLLVINATAGDSYVDPRFARTGQISDVEAYLADCGVQFELDQPVGVDAAGELLKAMDRPDAELLVIGIRNRNPVGKLLLGSVSQRMILECHKLALAVKPGRSPGLPRRPPSRERACSRPTRRRLSRVCARSRSWCPRGGLARLRHGLWSCEWGAEILERRRRAVAQALAISA